MGQEVNGIVDGVGRYRSEAVVNLHVHERIAVEAVHGKELLNNKGIANHMIDGQSILSHIVKGQLDIRRFGDHWVAGSKAGKEHVCRGKVANKNLVVVEFRLLGTFL